MKKSGGYSRHFVIPVRGALINSLFPAPAPLVRKQPRTFCGPKPKGNGGVPVFTDEEVLEIRRMRHWRGMTVGQIVAATGRPEGSIVGICEYRTRAHLDPGPRPVPATSAIC